MNNIYVVMIDSYYTKNQKLFFGLYGMNFENSQDLWDHLTNSDYYNDDLMKTDIVGIKDVIYVLSLNEFTIDYNDSDASQHYIVFITIDGH